MKKRIPLAPVVLILFCCFLPGCTRHVHHGPIQPGDYKDTIRVACVGDSITYGSAIKNRKRDCYPTQLGRMLGEGWQVRNFGVPGATMLKKGDKPYWNQKAFRQVLAYDPHVVIMKLGTNDTKPQNWKHKDEFVSDYRDMINCFEDLPARPRIYICYPVPAYGERWGISDATVKEEVIPLLEKVAEQEDVAIIDLYKPLSNKSGLFPDRIHPNAQGAKLIAEEIYEVLAGKQVTDPELSNTRLKTAQRHRQPTCPKM